MKKCHYCDKHAKYQLKNGRWCCKKSSNSCPAQREKNSKALKGRDPWGHMPEMHSIIGKLTNSWNTGKTYEEAMGARKAAAYKKKLSEATKKVHENGGYDLSPEAKQLKSERIRKAKTGGYKPGGGRGKGQWYVSKIAGRVYLDSSYEVFYAQYLDRCGTQWTKNKIRFDYIWEEQTRYYIPDFYLKDTDEYIEIKGFQTDKDLAKWKHFPYKLTVLFCKDLALLGFKGRIK